ncbi:MAG TPA: uracil-DNA glycosylase [Armatimonadota bacterium]|jgi:DNA polymerase
MSNLEIIQSLAAEAADCPRCDLAETRRNVVFGDGSADTPMMLIGEGPGENEDATGRPFVGRAGTLLDKALHANGIARKHVYITNIIKCRATLIEGGRMKNRPPRMQEVEACKPWLMRQIEIIQPLVIVCVGGPAASLMIHKPFQMTSERGQWFDSPYCRAITAVLHPAYVLRQEGAAYDQAYDLLVQDIGAARRKVIELKKMPPPPPAPPTSLF